MRIIVVTGLSGSGKSTAIRAFEDRDIFCVDNLPVGLIPGLVESVSSSDAEISDIVLGIDARDRRSLPDYQRVAASMTEAGHSMMVLYLEASDEVLIRRFSQTRRRHPLAGVDIHAALAQEKELLRDLRESASHIIDTSSMTVHQLKRRIQGAIDSALNVRNLSITLLSFGYKYGVPLEADLMYDVRCLKNPYFVEELRDKTGLEAEVYDYVMQHFDSRGMLEKIEEFLSFSIPLFEREGKTYLVVAIGCTGGRHRSVSMVRALNEWLQEMWSEYEISVRHRDARKEAEARIG